MITVRQSSARGHANHGWLDSHHTFSFADYHDPRHMGFRSLRVINEDRVAPGQGFPEHDHRDMEIVSIVLAGALAHKDSLGSGAILRPGEVQRMSAGTGVRHSEFNASSTDPLHFLQIWILPQRPGLPASYEQLAFDPALRQDALQEVISPDGARETLTVHQDVHVFLSTLTGPQVLRHALAPGRAAWIQLTSGRAEINGATVSAGDGVALTDEREVVLSSLGGAELVLFDLG